LWSGHQHPRKAGLVVYPESPQNLAPSGSAIRGCPKVLAHPSKPPFAHLWSLVLAMAASVRAAKLVHLAAAAPGNGRRTSAGSFLSRSGWDAPALVERAASDLLSSTGPTAGEVAYLIPDDTRIPNRGAKTGYVSKTWDHKQQRFVRGHVALTAAAAFRGAVLPWRVGLWKPEGHPGPRYRKPAGRHGRGDGQGVRPAGGREGAGPVRRLLPLPGGGQGVRGQGLHVLLRRRP
jgi:hypothetical protein